jgi:hypothetical protein
MKRGCLILLLLTGIAIHSSSSNDCFSQSGWLTDFRYQVPGNRPRLEVRYRDTNRDQFEIVAEDYSLTGDLLPPDLLYDSNTSYPWLWFEAKDMSGNLYSTKFSGNKTRINLYRRGPYYCEVHWFDLGLADHNGKNLPLKAEVVLYCFPDKIKASVKLFPAENIELQSFCSKGRSEKLFPAGKLEKDKTLYFSFDLYGETKPLPDSSFFLIKGTVPVKYDNRKGVYVVGSETAEGFQRQYFEQPNGYEEVSFRVKNDSHPRKIYLCHKTLKGEGIVEGGTVLDDKGYPLPILVQVSKNFNGEKEERFYNPADTAFSETYFPLYLEPYEELSISSLHLYQNWGRHMTKHWSSLGFFMDYFHSSTGVTETTCYIPFKFGHKTGITIGDFRAMSQKTFWSGQPQHDNVAGHNFMTFYDGKKWNYSEYRGTTYKSTGPNWCNVEIEYLSSDSTIQLLLDIWEVPQDDELRSFFTARYKVLRPLTVEDAKANFRFLDISTTQQSLRYKNYAYTDPYGRVRSDAINFGSDPFCLKGIEIASVNSFAAVYGETKGSNGIMIRSFRSNSGLMPAFSIQQKSVIPEPRDTTVNEHKVYTPDLRKGDIKFSIVPSADHLELKPGDEVVLSGFWLPYGEYNGFQAPVREIASFGNGQPVISSVKKGQVLNDLPTVIRVENNEAEFTMKGGFDVMPVIAKGFSDYRNLVLFRKVQGNWTPVYLNQNWSSDGNQVFCDSDGRYGAVFLVRTNGSAEDYKIAQDKGSEKISQLKIFPVEGKDAAVKISDISGGNSVVLKMNSGLVYLKDPEWKKSDGNSVWFTGQSENFRSGVRVTGFEESAVIQCWWEPVNASDTVFTPEMELNIVKDNGFESFKPVINEDIKGLACFYSSKSDQTIILAFKDVEEISYKSAGRVYMRLTGQQCQKGRRKVFEGYFYISKGKPGSVYDLVKQEMPLRGK